MKIEPFVASTFKSDGGAMFGLVPKPIWSRMAAPNEKNQIAQHAHSVFVETDDGLKGLVDLGCGPAALYKEKELRINGMGPGWPLDNFLAERNLSREAIDFVVFSHLHWDHAGGLLDANMELSFPRASYFIHAIEWADAHAKNPLLGYSYPPLIKEALDKIPEKQLILIEDEQKEVMPGIQLCRTSGHTRGHCAVHFDHPNLSIHMAGAPLEQSFAEAIFASDVCPTRHHLRLVFQTSYDTYPLDTRAWKMNWLKRISEDNLLLLLCHDPDAFGITLETDDQGNYKTASSFAST